MRGISGDFKTMIYQLHGKTRFGLTDCKKALQQANGDMAKAEEWLESRKPNPLTTLDYDRPPLGGNHDR